MRMGDRYFKILKHSGDGHLVSLGHTGQKSRAHFFEAHLYASSTNSWPPQDLMNLARSGHTDSLLMNGQVLAAGPSGSN